MISSSRSSPSNTQSSQTSVQNLNLQDTQGVTVANSTGVTVTTTDYDAIEAGREVSVEALRTAGDSFATAANLAGRGLDSALDTVRDINLSAYDFSAGALGRVADLADTALLGQSNIAGQALDFAEGFVMQASATADDRVAKVAQWALLAVAAVLVLPAVFGRAKA